MTTAACSTTLVSSLPQLVRDLPSAVSHVVEAVPPAAAPTNSEAVVCRTVVVRADREQLQADLERELRALLGFGGRLSR